MTGHPPRDSCTRVPAEGALWPTRKQSESVHDYRRGAPLNLAQRKFLHYSLLIYSAADDGAV